MLDLPQVAFVSGSGTTYKSDLRQDKSRILAQLTNVALTLYDNFGSLRIISRKIGKLNCNSLSISSVHTLDMETKPFERSNV